MKCGAALPMVLLSLAIVAALSVGGSFVTQRYLADARLQQGSLDLEPATEQALVGTAVSLDSAALVALSAGATSVVATPSGWRPPGIVTRIWITRLNDRTFVLVGESETTRKPLLYNRLRLVVRLDSAGLTPLHPRSWGQLP